MSVCRYAFDDGQAQEIIVGYLVVDFKFLLVRLNLGSLLRENCRLLHPTPSLEVNTNAIANTQLRHHAATQGWSADPTRVATSCADSRCPFAYVLSTTQNLQGWTILPNFDAERPSSRKPIWIHVLAPFKGGSQCRRHLDQP